MRLQDRTAVITGGGRGLGRAIAERFLAEGAKVLLADVDAATLVKTAEELGCLSCPTDVAEKDQIDRMVATAIEAFGHIDILRYIV